MLLRGMSPEYRQTHGIPDGFCGKCDTCGKPGHMNHFPGPVPYTGAWCDRCYRIVAWLNPRMYVVYGILLVMLVILVWVYLGAERKAEADTAFGLLTRLEVGDLPSATNNPQMV